ncbi:MAG: hypothetical protein V4617_00325 [Gemmatimonadota bacterium]
MAIWDKVRQGIDKAGKAAQDIVDEGKLRIDAYRARELADKAAEALGYAVFRAMDSGHELETSARERLVAALREREMEAKRLEAELELAKASGEGMHPGGASAAGSPPPPPAAPTPPPAAPPSAPPPTTPGEGFSGE